MTPYKSKKSFKTRLVIAISIVNLAVILAITYLTYRWNAQQLQEQTITQTQQTIEQAGTNVSTYMDELYRLTLTPYYNDEVLSQLEYSPTNSRDKLNSKRIVEGFLSSVVTLPRSEILRVYIANDDLLYSYTRTPNDMPDLATYAESSWYNEAKETTKPLFIEPHMERVYGEKPTTVFSVVRQLRSKNDNSKTIGVVKVDADYSGISKICNRINLNAGGLLLIVNSQNQVLYRSAPIPSGLEDAMADGNKIGQSGTITLNGQKYLVNVLSLSNYSMDGLNLAKFIQEDYPDTVVIIISGFNDFSYARKAIQYGVKDYLLKPLVDDDLIKLLNDISKRLQKHTPTLLANPTEEERANPRAMLFRAILEDDSDGIYQGYKVFSSTDTDPMLPYACVIQGYRGRNSYNNHQEEKKQFPTNIRRPDMLGVDVLVYRFGHKYVFDSNFAKRKRSFRIH